MKHKKIFNPGFLIFEVLIAFSIFFTFISFIFGFYSHLVCKSNLVNKQLKTIDISNSIESLFYIEGLKSAQNHSKKLMNENPGFKIILKTVDPSLFTISKSAELAILEISYEDKLLKNGNVLFNTVLTKNPKNVSKINAKFVNE